HRAERVVDQIRRRVEDRKAIPVARELHEQEYLNAPRPREPRPVSDTRTKASRKCDESAPPRGARSRFRWCATPQRRCRRERGEHRGRNNLHRPSVVAALPWGEG